MRKRSRRHLLVPLLALATAIAAAPSVARLTPSEVGEALAHAPETVAELPVEIAARATGRHLGFDTHSYPGDRAMRAWRTAGPYEWVGYYLPAPCHRDASWSGTRERIERMGYGIAVIYVGQQTWDGVAQPSARVVAKRRRDGTLDCHRSLLTAERGRADADDAIAVTRAEGFPRGTVIYLDIEYMDRTTPAMRAYYRAWTRRVIADGRYRPGYYVHTRNAAVVHRDVRKLFAELGVREAPPFWVASGGRFAPGKAPHESGHEFATMWQGVLDTKRTHGGVTLHVDVNVAAVPSPSAPLASGSVVAVGD